MPRLRFGVTRYASVMELVERQLAAAGRVTCHVGAGRVYVVLRSAGATRWDPATQVQRAREMAATARAILDADARAPVRAHARHAMVVRFEDVAVADGCTMRAQWECVVPAHAS